MPSSTLVRLTVVAGFFCASAAGNVITSGSISVNDPDGQGAYVDYSLFISDGVSLLGSQRLYQDGPNVISNCNVAQLRGAPCVLSTPGGISPNVPRGVFEGGIVATIIFSSTLNSLTPAVKIDNQVFTVPFTILDGQLAGVNVVFQTVPCQLPEKTPTCTAPLTGSGTETVSVRYTPGLYYISNVTYEFKTPTNTPEPSTLFLFAAGVLAVAYSNRGLFGKQRR